MSCQVTLCFVELCDVMLILTSDTAVEAFKSTGQLTIGAELGVSMDDVRMKPRHRLSSSSVPKASGDSERLDGRMAKSGSTLELQYVICAAFGSIFLQTQQRIQKN